MSREDTPLLRNDYDSIYDVFTTRQKRALVTIVSWAGLVAYFSAGTFLPSIPQIAKDLNSNGEVISAVVSVSMLASSIGGLIGSTYSKFYGRRPSYLWFLPIMIIGSLGVARSQNVPALIFWRVIQGLGSSPGLSVGAGVIGDIYKIEERGVALGTYFGTCLLGWAIAPTIGGAIAHYWSWRGIHYLLAIFAFGSLFCVLSFFPETSHPGTRGIDKYKKNGKSLPKWRPVVLNPFSQLLLLRSPVMLSMTLIGFLALMTDFTLMLPLPYTIGKKYGITNEAILGACVIPLGLGNMIGSPLSGWLSDRTVIRYKQKRGYWYPEDRLRACFFSWFLPLTVLAPGLIITFVSNRTVGLALCLVCFFINGIGCDMVLAPSGAYIVDVLQTNSAEATAVINAVRGLLQSVGTALILPSINRFGLVFTNSLVAFLSVVGMGLTALTIYYGESLRGWVDIGYSTKVNKDHPDSDV
ncbi:hypothetical protein NP233_g1075 [Leucocoprinus birnbaumii]|uniref:Major facilitator superfamily (MFS) profile domain-containing protein n=1 Tax=Leucocoprinus birnbaumii TaxID=56174 RepID=A0AAD5W5Z2_9AGAR|nr:hypothetical protein NP233_g1075 [Leucocoprinus birnbaumii]